MITNDGGFKPKAAQKRYGGDCPCGIAASACEYHKDTYLLNFRTDCRCRCHGKGPVAEYCCPECEPEAFALCVCGKHEYQHRPDEREGSPGACEQFRARST